MKTLALIEGRTVELEKSKDNTFVVNGVSKTVDVRVIEPGLYSLIIDGQSYEVTVKDEKKNMVVEFESHYIPVKLADPYSVKAGAAGAGIEGAAVIASPMPGRVVSLKVEVGQAVKEGDGIVVVEAMKMENELQAPKSGKVTKVEVKVGDTVESGQDLVTIE